MTDDLIICECGRALGGHVQRCGNCGKLRPGARQETEGGLRNHWQDYFVGLSLLLGIFVVLMFLFSIGAFDGCDFEYKGIPVHDYYND